MILERIFAIKLTYRQLTDYISLPNYWPEMIRRTSFFIVRRGGNRQVPPYNHTLLMSHGHGSPRKGMSPTANTRDTRDRMIVSGTNTWLIPEDV